MEEFPFLTKYDPPGSSEGSLDPIGLYLIADQLATKLVPAVRERMLRVRFLTAMTVGALVTEGLEPNPKHPETPPYVICKDRGRLCFYAFLLNYGVCKRVTHNFMDVIY